ncbi:hypothetical protein CDD83_9724 [Cordyceps sp. RAO-2017]|nr:hypothetical protein CDD83_9724 [Cordyceps sp. RAO-2017]
MPRAVPLVTIGQSSRQSSRQLVSAFFVLMALHLVLVTGAVVPSSAASSHCFSPPFTNATGVSWRPSPVGQRTCGQATFADDTTLVPANWRRCSALYSEWAAENGSFHVVKAAAPRVATPLAASAAGSTFVPILGETDCALAVEIADASLGPLVIGSQDLEALLFNSLKDYSRGTLLAVTGTLECDLASGGGHAPLSWKISKTATARRK